MTACHVFSLFGNDQAVAIFDMQPALPYLITHTHLQTHPKHLGQNGPSQWRMIEREMSTCHAFSLFGKDQIVAIFDMQPALPYLACHA